MTLVEGKLGEVCHGHHQTLVEADVLAIVVLNNLRLYVGSAHVGGCIYVRDKPNDGAIFHSLCCRNAPHHIAIFIHGDLGKPERNHLVVQRTEEY